jgi:hypothetical protein
MKNVKDYFSKKFQLNNTHLIDIEFKGLSCPSWNNEENEKENLTYKISITNLKLNKKISFLFWDSQHETEIYNQVKDFSLYGNYGFKVFINNGFFKTELKNKDIIKWKSEKPKKILYSVLTSVSLDYYTDFKNEFDFFKMFGYEPSRKNKMLYYRVLEQAEKLQSVFSEEDLKLFDENDDILNNTIEKHIKEVV